MDALAGPFYAAALLLAAAGAVKLVRPGAAAAALRAAGLPSHTALVRVLGLTEMSVAGLALAAGAGGAAAVAVAYLGFAAFARHAAGRAGSCGCFGSVGAPLGGLHVAVNLVLAGVAAIVAVAPLPGAGDLLAAEPAAGVPFALLTATTAYLLYLTMTRFAELRAQVRR